MRFVLIPKTATMSDLLADEDVPLDRASRASRYRSLRASRADAARSPDPLSSSAALETVRRDLGRDAEGTRIVAGPTDATPATGVFVIDAEHDEAVQAIARETGAEVVADEALPLIAPDILGGPKVADRAEDLTEVHLWHTAAIGLAKARRNGFAGTGRGVNVAVLDTGVAEVDEVAANLRDTIQLDVDAFVARPAPRHGDTHGHGTHVAGLIAGRTVGIAPEAGLFAVIALPAGDGLLTRYVLALEYVGAQEGIAVINMSAGRNGYHPNMRLVTRIHQRLGTMAFMATGNSGPKSSHSPGNYPEVVSVGACNADGHVWTKSSWQTFALDDAERAVPDLVAPGEAVTSCVKDGGFERWNGTSMATPIVSGLACLMLERFPDMTRRELTEAILSSCTDLAEPRERQGSGLIQLPPKLVNPPQV